MGGPVDYTNPNLFLGSHDILGDTVKHVQRDVVNILQCYNVPYDLTSSLVHAADEFQFIVHSIQQTLSKNLQK